MMRDDTMSVMNRMMDFLSVVLSSAGTGSSPFTEDRPGLKQLSMLGALLFCWSLRFLLFMQLCGGFVYPFMLEQLLRGQKQRTVMKWPVWAPAGLHPVMM
jgi:hypothetical protein